MLSGAVQRLGPGVSVGATGEVTEGIEHALHGIEDLGVTLQDVVNVRSYLQDHPDLLEPMQATAMIARERLPEGTRIALGLYRDPEIDDEYLALYARPPVLDLKTLKMTFDEIARLRAPFIRGRSGRVMVLPDFSAA